MWSADTPIFAQLIVELGHERGRAADEVVTLGRLVRDLEALHEPDASGECPTCGTDAPCVTLLLVRREVTLDQACAIVRDRRPIDLTSYGTPRTVPSLSELLDATAGTDRFFDALLGSTPRQPGPHTT